MMNNSSPKTEFIVANPSMIAAYHEFSTWSRRSRPSSPLLITLSGVEVDVPLVRPRGDLAWERVGRL